MNGDEATRSEVFGAAECVKDAVGLWQFNGLELRLAYAGRGEMWRVEVEYGMTKQTTRVGESLKSKS